MSLSKVEKRPYTPISISTWTEENREDLEREFVTLYGEEKKFPAKCDECHGFGESECDLGHYHDCEECDGSGNTQDPVEKFIYDAYMDRVERDGVAFLRYQEEMKNAS